MFCHFNFLFHFHLLMTLIFCQLKLYLNKLLNKSNNSFCLWVRFSYFIIPGFFIPFNLFKLFKADISLIVLFLISLTKSLMSIYLNSPILFLQLNLLLSIIAKIFSNLFLSNQLAYLSVVFLSSLGLLISIVFSIGSLIVAPLTTLFFLHCSFSFLNC